jgi:hypothetical protein
MLEVAGYTTDGKMVIKGIFRFFETTGLPLDIIVDQITSRGCVPSWYDYFLEATAAGIPPERVKSRMEEVILDVYGRKYWEDVKERLEKFFNV